jgi:hypothetical protein
MHDHEYAGRIDAVKQRAHGRWSEILASAGVEEQILKHRNGPCPLCGGTDRFQYTDKFGEGNYHCRQCGPGGGFKLLQAVKGVDFNAALRDVERCLGLLPEDGGSADERALGRPHAQAGTAHLGRSPAGDGRRRGRSLPPRPRAGPAGGPGRAAVSPGAGLLREGRGRQVTQAGRVPGHAGLHPG